MVYLLLEVGTLFALLLLCIISAYCLLLLFAGGLGCLVLLLVYIDYRVVFVWFCFVYYLSLYLLLVFGLVTY